MYEQTVQETGVFLWVCFCWRL